MPPSRAARQRAQMIAASSKSDQPQGSLETLPRPHWQQLLADAVKDPDELCRILGLDPAVIEGAHPAIRQFPLRVPRSFVAKMRPGDPRDPLLLQVLPVADEMRAVAGFELDPVGDLASRATQGVLHKYEGRTL